MFERFSSGYYLGTLYVEPHDGDRALIQRADHERVNEQLYAIGEGVERLDAPLVMKLDTGHIPVDGDESVPSGTLVVPDEIADETLPSERNVLLADADRAADLLQLEGWQPDAGV
ncbi:hypothetical protein SAMN05192561_11333 [Halopenitus malekzadehii]|uniref:Uncharacterized protein n=1 Tax=Halopenitus malekzadehii TaxID=1267564 RepID=A0A1H6JHE4_9EURY|nr:DUF5802 family protein [Halopenitus malekzadehii]SEH61703.1 hypothetical protein SAMN05192561_11333 [Halopenitus malekzadehii]